MEGILLLSTTLMDQKILHYIKQAGYKRQTCMFYSLNQSRMIIYKTDGGRGEKIKVFFFLDLLQNVVNAISNRLLFILKSLPQKC